MLKDPMAEDKSNNLRVAWMADIFDEVSGVITDTIEFYEMAREKNIPWYPISTYNKDLYPFYNFSTLVKLPTGSFYKGTNIRVPLFSSIINYLIKQRINIIVSNTPAAMGWVGMAAARFLNIPWIDIYHTDIDFYMNTLSSKWIKPFTKSPALFFLKMYQKRADLIYVRTPEYYDLMIQKGHEEEKLRFFPAGVNNKKFNPQNSDRTIWKSYGIDPEKLIILFVGRITKVKDIDYLLNAVMKKNYQNVEVVLIGGGPETELYTKKYSGIDNIHFLGVKTGEELLKIYASSDLYVLPSASETLGKTVLESLASGVPVFVSDKGGPKEYVKDNINGFIFKAKDENDFERRFDDVIKNPEKIHQLKKNAVQSILDHTDEKLFIKFTEEISDLVFNY